MAQLATTTENVNVFFSWWKKSYVADSDDVNDGRKNHMNVCLRMKSVRVIAVLDAIGFDCKFTLKTVTTRFSAMTAGRFSENPAARSAHTGMAATNVKPNRGDRRTRCASREEDTECKDNDAHFSFSVKSRLNEQI